MKAIALFTSIFLNLTLLSQTVITSSDFITAEDSIGISTSNNFTVDFATTGPNSTWDFSNLIENNQLFEIAYSIATGGPIINFQFGGFAPSQYQASFFQPFDGLPLDQLGNLTSINIEAINRMIKVENDKVTYLGYSLKVNGQQVGFRSDTI